MPALVTDPQELREIHEYGMSSSIGTGVLLRRNRYPAGKKHRTGYSLGWNQATQAEVDALVTLFGLVNGGGTLTWTPPGGTEGNYMIEADSLTVTHQSGGFSSLTITLEEV